MGIFVPAFGKARFLEVRTKRVVAIGETSVAELNGIERLVRVRHCGVRCAGEPIWSCYLCQR